MRRNLRLYWRALALLGALLSIIIDWPGVMVCALPVTLLQPTTTTTSAATLPQRHAHTMDKLLAANGTYAATGTLQPATNTYRSGSDSRRHVVVADGEPVNRNFILNINLNTNRNSSDNINYSESEQEREQTMQEAEHTTELPKSGQPKNATSLIGPNANSKHTGDSESVRHACADQAPAQHTPPTSSDDQLHNAQNIEKLNLISNKRKRKKFSDSEDALEQTSSSSSGANSYQPATATIAGDHYTTITTTATTPFSFSANSISNKYLITNNRNTNENLQLAAAPKRTLNKLETTTSTTTTSTPSIGNNNIANSYLNYIEEQVQATVDDAPNDGVSSFSNVLTSTSASDYEDQYESASRSSISYSYTTASPDDDDSLLSSVVAAAAPHSPAFTFASAHHTAILLSRTERSVRRSAPASTHDAVGASRRAVRHHGGANNGGIVRRSSDGSPKSRRLNNFRNLNGSRHVPNNLDRNERSTISHLSGLSRKIQIYIKNRFIQLLPDGTVNGTQDEQSDYSEYEKCFKLILKKKTIIFIASSLPKKISKILRKRSFYSLGVLYWLLVDENLSRFKMKKYIQELPLKNTTFYC